MMSIKDYEEFQRRAFESAEEGARLDRMSATDKLATTGGATGLAPVDPDDHDLNVQHAARWEAELRAVNLHDDLLAALKGFTAWYERLPEPGLVPDSVTLSARLREACALIERAEGRGV